MYKTVTKNHLFLWGGAVLFLTSGLMVGCSSDTMRFADAFYQDALPGQAGRQTVGQANTDNRPYDYGMSTAAADKPRQQTADVQHDQYPPAPSYNSHETISAAPVYQQEERRPREQITPQNAYIVQHGDTLYDISIRSGVSMAQLKEANTIVDDSLIRIGEKIAIPGGARVAPSMVRSGGEPVRQVAEIQKNNQRPIESANTAQQSSGGVVSSFPHGTAVSQGIVNAPEKIQNASTQNSSVQNASVDTKKEIEKTTEVAAVAPKSTGISEMRWPARGRVLSSYGEKEGNVTNDGIDISLPEGSAVKSAENGVVIYAGSGLKEFGNTVLVKHESNIVTVYGHNGNLLVKKGDKVTRGQDIAKSGMSGNATTPRLHFEVRKNSAPVNPIGFLEK